MILGYCRFCHSSKTKISYAYPTDYYCEDCKEGDSLDTLLSKSQLDQKLSKSGLPKGTLAVVLAGTNIEKSLKVSSNKPCMEICLDEDFQIAVWPQDDGICDYDEKIVLCEGVADAMILHNKGFNVVSK